MKKNVILYVLLVFLIIVNGIFLFLFLNKTLKIEGGPEDFITKELKFDEQQLVEYRRLNEIHHRERRMFSDDIKQQKDVLFNMIGDENVTKETIDSITNLIGKKEQSIDRMTFYHFRAIREICNENQRVRFDNVIEEGLHRGRREQGPPPTGRREQGPPPPRN